MDIEYVSPEEKDYIELLTKLDQTHITSQITKHTHQERVEFLDQLKKLNSTYPGGLETYCTRAKKLLQDSKDGANPYEGFTPSPPPTETLHYGADTFEAFEEEGIQEVGQTAFVLVAGGLGERLGYPGIKVQIPLDLVTETCFLQYYIRYILAFQKKHGNDNTIPLAIMTSDDTHAMTVKLLEEHNYFGLHREQLTIMKQEKVPALLDNDAHFALVENKLLIDTKPHGHGDVHTLLYQYGLVQRWYDLGKKWIVFFQDTNPLVFRSVPAILGVSKKRGFEMNSVVVPRKPGEAVGALCTLSKTDGSQITINVEYNQVESLFKSVGGEKTDERGFSVYPGNINCLVFSVKEMLNTLNLTKGNISEFINPKYADSTKTKFKSATRLECMMQDYPKLLTDFSRVGVTQLDKLFSFSACKNDLKTAADKFRKDLPPECASSCEHDFYESNREILRFAGFEFEKPTEKKGYAGIEYPVETRVVMMPEFGVTLKEIKKKLKGKNYATARSTLVLDNDSILDNLRLDGSLWVKESQSVSNVVLEERNYVEVEETNDDNEPAFIKIRGYKLANKKNIKYL